MSEEASSAGVAAPLGSAGDSSSPTSPSSPLSDEELEQLLHEREQTEAEEVLDLARKGLRGDSPCPVCRTLLDEATPPGILSSLFAGGDLSCDHCAFQSQAAPSTFALWGVRPVVTGALLYWSISKIFEAQRIAESQAQLLAFALGFGIFGAAAAVWYSVGGAASPKLLQQRILAHRRRREDEQAGVVAPQTGGGFGEQLEAIVVAVILALIIRHFVMEAFVIPTGSMAPTLLGDHFEVECASCGYEFALGKSEGELTRATDSLIKGSVCPLCKHNATQTFVPKDVVGGHKILVNKFIYALRPPERYEVVVFKKPDAPHRNYIKRLVGLPGETLRISNGDLFTVADGRAERARRPDHVQDAIWIPVHDSAYARSPDAPRPPWWQTEGEGNGAWSFGREGQPDLDGDYMTCTPRGEGAAWLRYLPTIRTSYAYAGSAHTSGEPISDLRARVRVTPQDQAEVRIGIRETYYGQGARQLRLVSARFPAKAGTGEFAIEVDGQVQATLSASALVPGRAYDLALAYADDRARLLVDGKTVLAWDDPAGPEDTAEGEVLLSSSKAPALFEHTKIDRDIYYVRGVQTSEFDPSRGDVTIPPNSYFCMGDHSPNSLDSRSWGFVHEGYMIGRAFMIFWPLQPKHLRAIR